MFRVKICGITNVDDALAVAAAGADAIGLNFFPGSVRCVDVQTARRIVATIGGRVTVVGVFVNATLEQMKGLADQLPLNFVQLHGDESPARLQELPPRGVIRVFRLRPGEEQGVVEFLGEAQRLKAPPAAVLVDAYQKGVFGGTGESADWEQVARLRNSILDCPLILAGGLNPSNVRDAIRRTRCAGVDTASGVEAAPGKKDVAKIRQFVASARDAFDELAGSDRERS